MLDAVAANSMAADAVTQGLVQAAQSNLQMSRGESLDASLLQILYFEYV